LCCQCGTLIDANPANMCVGCIRAHVDITEGIPKQSTLYFCRFCLRYLQPPSTWVQCVLESRELLALCLKRLKGLTKVRLVDAGFVWTEPHSKRVKVKLTVQKEVLNCTILQQQFVVEYVVHHQMCDECQRREAKDYWKAVCQVRQRTSHKKTFFYLEQLLIKHQAHSNAVKIVDEANGLDFFFASKDDSRKLVDFLQSVVPCRYKTSQHLVSHDCHSNIYNYKYTFSVEIVPICKDDVVCLPLKVANSLGNIGQLLICTQITNTIHLTDPTTLQTVSVQPDVFWKQPFHTICTQKQLIEYTILEIEFIEQKDARYSSEKYKLADVWIVKSKDLGISDTQFHCRTHLGNIISPGDTILGFDINGSNVNNDNFYKMPSRKVPDVILVKKHFGDKRKRHSKRNWKLKSLKKETGANIDMETDDMDYDNFLEDLEEDPTYRQNVNIYKDPKFKGNKDSRPDPDEQLPSIGLEEMLEDLCIDDEEDNY
ncbi:uncharacterized protein TRIADDRAFT_27425, partial [Trichoplax adhaerens]